MPATEQQLSQGQNWIKPFLATLPSHREDKVKVVMVIGKKRREEKGKEEGWRERKRKKEGKKEKERGGKNERARKKRKELILAVGRQWSLFSVGNQSSA